MTPTELFQALEPWAHRIADTQRALLNDRDTPHQPLQQPHGPIHWHDTAHHAAQHWATACRAYLIHNNPALWDHTSYQPTMTWPQDWTRLCQLPHNRPEGLTWKVLDGALHRAGLRHTKTGALAPAQGTQIKCAQPGCTGTINIGNARCGTCHASFKTALIYRCQHDDCDHILDQNQIETGLCAQHRKQQRADTEQPDTGCHAGRKHRWLHDDEGNPRVCVRCHRPAPNVDSQ